MDVAGTIHRHLPAIGSCAGASEGGGPLMDPRRIEFRNKNVGGACGGDVAGTEVHCPGEVSSDMDVAGTIHRHPVTTVGSVGAGASEGGGPLMDPRGVEFGDKHIGVARGGDVAGTKINCPIEVSGDMDVAGTVHRHPKAKGDTGASEGGGPLMGTRRIQFRTKRINAAGSGDVAGPKINCPAESSSGVHVAGTIHRHPPVGTVATGAAEGGRTPIRITTSTGTPCPNRRPPPNHNHQRHKAGRNE